LSLGVESGDPDVFGAIGKGETLDDIRRGITMIQKAGITPWLNFIVGLPGDNPVRHRNSVEWAKSIDEPRIVHWFQFSPFRGTRAFKQLVKEGAIDDDFIPSPYGRKYSELPWDADFETVDFSKEQRAYAQLSGFMECDSPVVAASKKAWAMTPESVWELYVMRNKEKIDTYMRESVPDKQRRGQL
jgi:hypothetical protein